MLHELVEQGNTIAVIEHNLEVIKTADWIIDLGPNGGDGGGMIVAEGVPEDIAKVKESYTGQFLKDLLKRRPLNPNKITKVKNTKSTPSNPQRAKTSRANKSITTKRATTKSSSQKRRTTAKQKTS